MQMKGGNTDELYQGDGRLKMAQSLMEQHPDVTRLMSRFGRWQHYVDYRRFKHNQLIRKPGLPEFSTVDNYGMILKIFDKEYLNTNYQFDFLKKWYKLVLIMLKIQDKINLDNWRMAKLILLKEHIQLYIKNLYIQKYGDEYEYEFNSWHNSCVADIDNMNEKQLVKMYKKHIK